MQFNSCSVFLVSTYFGLFLSAFIILYLHLWYPIIKFVLFEGLIGFRKAGHFGCCNKKFQWKFYVIGGGSPLPWSKLEISVEVLCNARGGWSKMVIITKIPIFWHICPECFD